MAGTTPTPSPHVATIGARLRRLRKERGLRVTDRIRLIESLDQRGTVNEHVQPEAFASDPTEALVKLRIAEALQGKKIVVLPVSEGGMNLKTTDINALLNTMGIKSLSGKP